jgi:cell division protein FtsQ
MKPAWAVLGGGALLVAGWLVAPTLGRKLAYFDVRHVEVVGARHVPHGAIVESLKLPRSASVFDPLAPIAQRAKKVPGVRAAEVSRRLPGTLVVKVTEAIPVALANTKQGLRMLDDRGRTLPFEPSRSAPDLPIVPVPDSIVAQLLGRMRTIDPDFFQQVDAAWRVRGDVVLRLDDYRVWLRGDATASALEAVRLVTRQLEKRGRPWAELDGRFADQVVVRWRSA